MRTLCCGPGLLTLAATLALALVSPPAQAQTPVQVPRSGRSTAGVPVIEGVDVSSALATKTDVANGTLTSPTINTGLTMNGTGSVVFTPLQSPLPNSRTSAYEHYVMNQATQEFGRTMECHSYTVSSVLGGNVCLDTHIEVHPGSGSTWGGAHSIQIDPGFNTLLYSIVRQEDDINNLAADYGDWGAANSVGHLINGLGHMNTAAVSVQTGNTTGTLAIWYQGLSFGPNSVKQYTLRDMSSSNTTLYVQNSHVFVLDLSDANTSGAAVRLGNGGATQGVVAHVRTGGTSADYPLIYADGTGAAHVGTAALGTWYSEGNIVPGLDITYSLGTPTRRWADVESLNLHSTFLAVTGQSLLAGVTTSGNIQPATDNSSTVGTPGAGFSQVYTKAINGVLVPSIGTPLSSSAACTPGQMMMDSAYHYDCVALNTWRRVALSAF